MRLDAPNKPDAVNLAMALQSTIKDQWRRVTDLERYMKVTTLALLFIVLSAFSAAALPPAAPTLSHDGDEPQSLAAAGGADKAEPTGRN
jgi:hypothetical protein